MISDLGPDYRRRKGVIMACGTCCCTCIHTIVASGFFLAGLAKAAAKPDVETASLGRLPILGMVVSPLAVLGYVLLLNAPLKALTALGYLFMYLGPVIFLLSVPLVWIGGAAGIMLETLHGDEKIRTRRFARLGQVSMKLFKYTLAGLLIGIATIPLALFFFMG